MKISITLFGLFVALCLISVEGGKPLIPLDDCDDSSSKDSSDSKDSGSKEDLVKDGLKGRWKRSPSGDGNNGGGNNGGGDNGGGNNGGGNNGGGGNGGGKDHGKDSLLGLKLDDILKLNLLG